MFVQCLWIPAFAGMTGIEREKRSNKGGQKKGLTPFMTFMPIVRLALHIIGFRPRIIPVLRWITAGGIMSIYDKPTKALMEDFAKEKLSPGQVFAKRDAVVWFAKHYPDIKSTTVQAHVEAMAVNSRSRKHYPNVKSGSGHDLFLKVGPARYRLWNPESDPRPAYSNDMSSIEGESDGTFPELEAEEIEEAGTGSGAQEFAYERDLQNYLLKNLGSLETGLRLYEDEGLTGVEYPAGGRYIDILAVDADNNFVVIELKVSKGYDRTVGQILRYMAWVEENLAEKTRVRGIILANEISEDLKLAASRIPDVQLAEYQISFHINAVE